MIYNLCASMISVPPLFLLVCPMHDAALIFYDPDSEPHLICIVISTPRTKMLK